MVTDMHYFVCVWILQDERRRYQFEYILVDLDKFPRRTIVVEDDR